MCPKCASLFFCNARWFLKTIVAKLVISYCDYTFKQKTWLTIKGIWLKYLRYCANIDISVST
jgi:hypothetical protein